MLLELQRLTRLNEDLLRANLNLWKIMKGYYDRQGIEIPYDPALSYRIKQADRLDRRD